MPRSRRFPPPPTAEETAARLIVRDATVLPWRLSTAGPGAAANLMTEDEARYIIDMAVVSLLMFVFLRPRFARP
jgi:hypothetical protein